MGLRMHFPFSFITKRVDVSMGCQRCESHKLVMAAVAEMGPGQSLGHNYIKWWVNGCSCGGQLLVAVAACLGYFAVLRDRLGVCPSWFRVSKASGPRILAVICPACSRKVSVSVSTPRS